MPLSGPVDYLSPRPVKGLEAEIVVRENSLHDKSVSFDLAASME
jgi:hypothetical protein